MPTGKGFTSSLSGKEGGMGDGAKGALLSMKERFFKGHSASAKLKPPAELVRAAVDSLRPLVALSPTAPASAVKPNEKVRVAAMEALERQLGELMQVLYGDTESPPNADAVAQLTAEVFRGDFIYLLVHALPFLSPASRHPAAQIVASLQRQQGSTQGQASRLPASDYLREHPDILKTLLDGYDNADIALFSGSMLRDCVRHQDAAVYVLRSPSFFHLLEIIEQPEFEIASDAAATLKELLMRHKAIAAAFVSENHERFFHEYTKLLESTSYVTRRTAVKMLADMLAERQYAGVLAKFVGDAANLRAIMNVLKDSSKAIQKDAFQIFRLMVLHPDKSVDVVSILVANRDKILRFIDAFSPFDDATAAAVANANGAGAAAGAAGGGGGAGKKTVEAEFAAFQEEKAELQKAVSSLTLKLQSSTAKDK